MSLLDLRDRHVNPAIDSREIVLGHMLHLSLDQDVDPREIADLQRSIQGLVSLREYINQHHHKSNDSDFTQAVYTKAAEFGLTNVKYQERKVIETIAEPERTAYQKMKAQPKTKAKTNAKTKTPEPKTKPAAAAAEAPAKAKAKIKTEAKAEIKAEAKTKIKAVVKSDIVQHVFQTGEKGLYYSSRRFAKIIAKDDYSQELIDGVIRALALGQRPISEQISSVGAIKNLTDLKQHYDAEITTKFVSLHKLLKPIVGETKDSVPKIKAKLKPLPTPNE